MALMPSPQWAKPKPPLHRYCASIAVTRTPFSRLDFIIESAPERDEAVRRCREAASKEGWQPPAWWQWWRRRDSHEPAIGPCLSE